MSAKHPIIACTGSSGAADPERCDTPLVARRRSLKERVVGPNARGVVRFGDRHRSHAPDMRPGVEIPDTGLGHEPVPGGVDQAPLCSPRPLSARPPLGDWLPKNFPAGVGSAGTAVV